MRTLFFFLTCFVLMREAERAQLSLGVTVMLAFFFGLAVNVAWQIADGG